ncbi:MAG: glycosyltransferase family 39 protein [Bryobacteraceae bacterium]|nr:glycosyltransferase family 39 protein [Bryobacteraceae bacterium]
MYGTFAVFATAAAFVFNWFVGHRGLFLLDQSIIFDGGWRILQGQVPYRDFLMPFGPVTFLIQAAFFRVMGVSWSATVMPAALMNAVATASVMRTTRLLTGSRLAAAFGGAITAVCFAAPFGTLWLEQTAMFFGLLTIQASVEALSVSSRVRLVLGAASGVFFVLAVLSKQNFGVLTLPLAAVILLAGGQLSKRDRLMLTLAFTMSALISAGVFLFAIRDGWENFCEYSLRVTRELARRRITPDSIRAALTFSGDAIEHQLDVAGFVCGGLCLALAFPRLSHPAFRRSTTAGVLALLIAWYRAYVQSITLNEPVNSYSLAGFGAALGLGAILGVVNIVEIRTPAYGDCEGVIVSSQGLKAICIAFVTIWGLLFSIHTGRAAWTRHVQQFDRRARFVGHVEVAGLERLVWGEPTRIKKMILHRHDLEKIVRLLKDLRVPFFVMGDSTILYALSGVSPPQPMLYFQPRQSFFPTQAADLDRRVYKALVDNNARLVIREKETFLPGVARCFQDFPHLNQWFLSSFRLVSEVGIYEIWEMVDQK